MNDQKISYVSGTVGSDPKLRESRIGDLLDFRLAVTASYPKDGAQYGETDWYDVIVKNPGLQASVMREVYKGAKITVQGNVSSKEYDGKTQLSIWADRVGLVEYLRRDQVAMPAAVGASTEQSGDELGF